MNRVIKFRGLVKNGYWVYGTPVYYASGEVCVYNDRCPSYGYEATRISEMRTNVIPETVGQFTGLTDKNGKEIFEGDIVFNSNKTLLTLKEDKGLYLVKWENGCYNDENTWLKIKPGFTFEKIKTDGKSYISLIFNQSQIEVIGNIHENKTV